MKKLRNFHEGEVQLQIESGVDPVAYDAAVDQPFGAELNPSEVRFVGKRTFSVAASVDSQGRPWASPLLGRAGELFTVADLTTVKVSPEPIEGDPVLDNVAGQGHMGVLYFDPSIRRRAKSLGTGTVETDGTITYRMHRIFGICTKYIFKRDHVPADAAAGAAATSGGSVTNALSPEDVTQLESADTVFLASYSEAHGADPSHRGGNEGFISIINNTTIAMPDYPGNGMFQTLGNLVLDNRIGFLSLDFRTGRSLQLTGRGVIESAETPDGQVKRALVIEIEEVRVSQAPVGTWTDVEAFDLARVFGPAAGS